MPTDRRIWWPSYRKFVLWFFLFKRIVFTRPNAWSTIWLANVRSSDLFVLSESESGLTVIISKYVLPFTLFEEPPQVFPAGIAQQPSIFQPPPTPQALADLQLQQYMHAGKFYLATYQKHWMPLSQISPLFLSLSLSLSLSSLMLRQATSDASGLAQASPAFSSSLEFLSLTFSSPFYFDIFNFSMYLANKHWAKAFLQSHSCYGCESFGCHSSDFHTFLTSTITSGFPGRREVGRHVWGVLYKQCTSSLPLFQRNKQTHEVDGMWNSFWQQCPSSVKWALLAETVSHTINFVRLLVALERGRELVHCLYKKPQTCLPSLFAKLRTKKAILGCLAKKRQRSDFVVLQSSSFFLFSLKMAIDSILLLYSCKLTFIICISTQTRTLRLKCYHKSNLWKKWTSKRTFTWQFSTRRFSGSLLKKPVFCIDFKLLKIKYPAILQLQAIGFSLRGESWKTLLQANTSCTRRKPLFSSVVLLLSNLFLLTFMKKEPGSL